MRFVNQKNASVLLTMEGYIYVERKTDNMFSVYLRCVWLQFVNQKNASVLSESERCP